MNPDASGATPLDNKIKPVFPNDILRKQVDLISHIKSVSTIQMASCKANIQKYKRLRTETAESVATETIFSHDDRQSMDAVYNHLIRAFMNQYRVWVSALVMAEKAADATAGTITKLRNDSYEATNSMNKVLDGLRALPKNARGLYPLNMEAINDESAARSQIVDSCALLERTGTQLLAEFLFPTVPAPIEQIPPPTTPKMASGQRQFDYFKHGTPALGGLGQLEYPMMELGYDAGDVVRDKAIQILTRISTQLSLGLSPIGSGNRPLVTDAIRQAQVWVDESVGAAKRGGKTVDTRAVEILATGYMEECKLVTSCDDIEFLRPVCEIARGAIVHDGLYAMNQLTKACKESTLEFLLFQNEDPKTSAASRVESCPLCRLIVETCGGNMFVEDIVAAWPVIARSVKATVEGAVLSARENYNELGMFVPNRLVGSPSHPIFLLAAALRGLKLHTISAREHPLVCMFVHTVMDAAYASEIENCTVGTWPCAAFMMNSAEWRQYSRGNLSNGLFHYRKVGDGDPSNEDFIAMIETSDDGLSVAIQTFVDTMYRFYTTPRINLLRALVILVGTGESQWDDILEANKEFFFSKNVKVKPGLLVLMHVKQCLALRLNQLKKQEQGADVIISSNLLDKFVSLGEGVDRQLYLELIDFLYTANGNNLVGAEDFEVQNLANVIDNEIRRILNESLKFCSKRDKSENVEWESYTFRRYMPRAGTSDTVNLCNTLARMMTVPELRAFVIRFRAENVGAQSDFPGLIPLFANGTGTFGRYLERHTKKRRSKSERQRRCVNEYAAAIEFTTGAESGSLESVADNIFTFYAMLHGYLVPPGNSLTGTNVTPTEPGPAAGDSVLVDEAIEGTTTLTGAISPKMVVGRAAQVVELQQFDPPPTKTTAAAAVATLREPRRSSATPQSPHSPTRRANSSEMIGPAQAAPQRTTEEISNPKPKNWKVKTAKRWNTPSMAEAPPRIFIKCYDIELKMWLKHLLTDDTANIVADIVNKNLRGKDRSKIQITGKLLNIFAANTQGTGESATKSNTIPHDVRGIAAHLKLATLAALKGDPRFKLIHSTLGRKNAVSDRAGQQSLWGFMEETKEKNEILFTIIAEYKHEGGYSFQEAYGVTLQQIHKRGKKWATEIKVSFVDASV